MCLQVWRERPAWQQSLMQEASLTSMPSWLPYRKRCLPTRGPSSSGSCHLLTLQVRHWCKDVQTHTCEKKITHEFTFSNLGTFKIQKTRLQREGYTPQDSGEEIYFLNSRAGRYEAVTDELYSAIMEGRACLWDRRRLRGNRLLKRVVFVFQRGKEDKVNKDFLTTTPLWILTWTFFILLFFIIIKFLKTFFIIKRNAFSLHCTVPYIFSVLFHSQ